MSVSDPNTLHIERLSDTLVDFSNVLTKTAIERLAEADEYEVVREVQVCPILALYNSFGLVRLVGILRRLFTHSPVVVLS